MHGPNIGRSDSEHPLIVDALQEHHGQSPDGITLLYVLTPLLWIPQAWLLARAVEQLHVGAGMAEMLQPALAVLLLSMLRSGCEAWAGRLMFLAARHKLSQWRLQVLRVLCQRSPLDRERMSAGAAASAMTEQAEVIVPWLTRYQGAMWRARIVPVLMLIPIACVTWLGALALVLAAPVIPLFMAIIGWRAKAASQSQWLQLGGMNGFLLDRLRGLPTLRAMGAVEMTAQALLERAERLREHTMRVLRIAFLSSAVLELFAALGVAMIAAYIGFHLLGYYSVGTWSDTLSLSEGLFVLLLAPAFFEPLRELAVVWHDRAAGEAAMALMLKLNKKGLNVLDAATTDMAPASSRSEPEYVASALTVQDLGFAFTDGEPLLERFNMNVSPGEHVAIAGASGAGKTVLLSVLAGLVPATHGRIVIDGEVMTADNVLHLRERVGWLGQRPYLLSGSVAKNVTLNRPGIDPFAVKAALSSVQTGSQTQRIQSITLLGEQGVGLSGGEGVRLGLARLVVDSRASLLLMDEPTAHLDAESADRVMDTVLAVAANRTLIIASHDPRVWQRMKRVVHLSPARQA